MVRSDFEIGSGLRNASEEVAFLALAFCEKHSLDLFDLALFDTKSTTDTADAHSALIGEIESDLLSRFENRLLSGYFDGNLFIDEFDVIRLAHVT